ncbi:MAG: asparaginase domain-containing protein [Saprospiraceae bacterium]
MTIGVFVTGGTFDKDYNLINGNLGFQQTHVPEMFKRGRSTLDIDIQVLMMIDSLEMTAEQRQYIVDSCEKSPYHDLIITHGTDTMVETAKVLASADLDKTIVMTGAMRPYKLGSSDGFFNLGSAVAFAQTLPNGVYIAMNGRYYHWNNVRKNKSTGFFEELKSVGSLQ